MTAVLFHIPVEFWVDKVENSNFFAEKKGMDKRFANHESMSEGKIAGTDEVNEVC